MMDITTIIVYVILLIMPISYLLFFRKKLHFFTGVSPNKFLLVYIFLSFMVTMNLFVILIDNCGLTQYYSLAEMVQAAASLLAVISGLIFFRKIIFKKE
ncbi:Uncharacterised protein [Candidatus Tiddalikarchaeum anstoanum]|nr:Uncharacterised protein [Candidatus Tiddalikarchaeum anstoanum]